MPSVFSAAELAAVSLFSLEAAVVAAAEVLAAGVAAVDWTGLSLPHAVKQKAAEIAVANTSIESFLFI